MNVSLALLLCLRFLSIAGSVTSVGDSCDGETAPEVVRVLSYNLWHGGDEGKQPLDKTVAVIRESKADIVGLQETSGHGSPRPDRATEIAKRLGWHYFDQGGRTGIISRFKIVGNTPNRWGVKLETASGRQLYAFNAHLHDNPYQPYQLTNIPYGNAPSLKTANEAVRTAKAARGGQVERMLTEAKAVLPEGLPVFLTGDFNEPSHLDWTATAEKAGLCPVAVAWPATKAVETAGFIDAYRQLHPDPTKRRGLTWTPTAKVNDPKMRHDRIDFVFVNGTNLKVRAAQIVGETPELADIVVTPFPSDHRTVVVEVELPGARAATK